MYLNHLRRNLQFIQLMLSLSVLLVSFVSTTPSIVHAQTEINQAYDCGTYGTGDYGQNDCLAADDTSTSASPTPPSTTAPTAEGSFPSTGANLELWAALGALILAIGLGLFGYARRRHRARQ